MTATTSSKRRKVRVKKEEASAPLFEIVEEEPNPVVESWSIFRQFVDPFLEASRNVLGDVYSSIAQAVLEQKEELEDRRAERKAEQRRVARKLRPGRSVSPRLEAGTLAKSAANEFSS